MLVLLSGLFVGTVSLIGAVHFISLGVGMVLIIAGLGLICMNRFCRRLPEQSLWCDPCCCCSFRGKCRTCCSWFFRILLILLMLAGLFLGVLKVVQYYYAPEYKGFPSSCPNDALQEDACTRVSNNN